MYGVKTNDYSWLRNFYPVKKFIQACKAQNIALQVFFATDFINKFSACLNDANLAQKNFCGAVVLLRGVTNPTIYNFLAQLKSAHKFLQKNNFYFTPSAKSKQIADDKLLQYKILGKIIPTTISACILLEEKSWQNKNVLERNFFCFKQSILGAFKQSKVALVLNKTRTKSCAQKLPYPCVLKPRFGSLGRNVVLANSFVDAKNYIAQNAQSAQADAQTCTGAQNTNFDAWILQKYIKSTYNAAPFDARFFVCGKKVVYKVARVASPSKSTCANITSNVGQGGKVCALKPIIKQKFCTAQNFCTQKSCSACTVCNAKATRRANALIAKMERSAIKALKKAGLDYGAVDFLLNDDFFAQKNFTPARLAKLAPHSASTMQKFTPHKKFAKQTKSARRAFYLCEINASPGFEGLDAFTNDSCAEQIVKALIAKLIK